MSVPLLVQTIVMFEALATVIQRATLYYVQRCPKELSNFHWVVDGKEVGKITNAEDWWKLSMCPLLQSRSLREPLSMIEGQDYSHFNAKFKMPVPEYMRAHVGHDGDTTDLGRLLRDSFRFSSDGEPWLELADIVTNATRRAMNGNLGEAGWSGIRRLMIHRPKQYVHLVSLSQNCGAPDRKVPYAEAMKAFRTGGKDMVPDRRG